MEHQSAIRDPMPDDEMAWRGLWAAYVAFYQATVPQKVTDATWRRILDPASPIFARLAIVDGTVIGFAVSVLHAGTWSEAPICYLEDLFVAPDSRGHGAGRALIADLVAQARHRGWSRLYWHTASGNAAARRLYDSFLPADGFVRYRMAFDGGTS